MLKIVNLNQSSDVVFFTDSLKFFVASKKSSRIISEVNKGQTLQEINKIYKISEDEYKKINQLLHEQACDSADELQSDVLPRLVINISNTCNLRCKYCYANGGSYGSDNDIMNLTTIQRTLDVFYKIFKSIYMIQLFGGEPILNCDAIEYAAKYVSGHHYKTYLTIVTNGTIMSDHLLDIIKRYNIKVTVSIDASAIHDDLRPYSDGKSSFDTINRNIKKLISETNCLSQFEVTYTKQHEDRNIKIIDIIKELKTRYGNIPIHIAPVSSESRLYKITSATSFNDSVNDVFYERRNNDNVGYSLILSLLMTLKTKTKMSNICGAGKGTIAVSSNGNIYPCFYFINKKSFKIASIYDDIKSVSEKVFDMRSEYSRKRKSKKCSGCFANTVCHGCMGANYDETGNIMESSKLRCDIMKGMLLNTLKQVSTDLVFKEG